MTREEVICGIRQNIAKLRDLALDKKSSVDDINTTTVCIFAGMEDLAQLDSRTIYEIEKAMEALK